MKETGMPADLFCTHFEKAIPKLREAMIEKFRSYQTRSGYRSVWEDYEDVINPIVTEFLKKPPLSILGSHITPAKSKSVYPDLKVVYNERMYAIDVKSGEDNRDPWYDMGRLDTYEEKHLNKYAAEYCITVRWTNQESPEVIDVYIELAFKSVGYRKEYDGVLYRPYDGKLRPKPWTDFETGRSHWSSLDHFLQGLRAARINRHMHYIVKWYQEMTESQRIQMKRQLDRIDSKGT